MVQKYSVSVGLKRRRIKSPSRFKKKREKKKQSMFWRVQKILYWEFSGKMEYEYEKILQENK